MTSSYHCRLHKIVVEQFGWVHTALNFMPKSVKEKEFVQNKSIFLDGNLHTRTPSTQQRKDVDHCLHEPSHAKSIPTIGKALKYHSRTPTGKLVSNVQYSSLPTSSKTVWRCMDWGPSATDCCTILPPPEKIETIEGYTLPGHLLH